MPISFPSNPSQNQIYTNNSDTWVYNGSGWDLQSGGIATSVAVTAPSSPAEGSMWLHSETGDLYVYAGGGWVLAGGGGGGSGGVAAVYDVASSSTGYFSLPSGTTAQRPATAANGMIRYNTTIGTLEQYNTLGWQRVGGDLPTISNIGGAIQSTIASNITVYGTNLGALQGTLRFSFGNVVSDVYATPIANTSFVANVPAAVYQQSFGVVGSIVWLKSDGTNSNSYAITIAAAPLVVEYLVVAGGGSGGQGNGNGHESGAGGAGGYRTGSYANLVLGTTYTMTVGGGGSASNGSDSTFHLITSSGGGKGANGSAGGNSGGSGGGGTHNSTAGGAGNTPSTTPAQGFAGGNGAPSAGGGGGGASAVGTGATSTVGGKGGDGIQNTISGSAVYYAGGGGGGGSGGAGAAGLGGGGAGTTGGTGNPGVTNTGGGGGGLVNSGGGSGNNGGSGIVVLRYPLGYTLTATVGITANTTVVGTNSVTRVTAGTGTVTFS